MGHVIEIALGSTPLVSNDFSVAMGCCSLVVGQKKKKKKKLNKI